MQGGRHDITLTCDHHFPLWCFLQTTAYQAFGHGSRALLGEGSLEARPRLGKLMRHESISVGRELCLLPSPSGAVGFEEGCRLLHECGWGSVVAGCDRASWRGAGPLSQGLCLPKTFAGVTANVQVGCCGDTQTGSFHTAVGTCSSVGLTRAVGVTGGCLSTVSLYDLS